MRIFIGMTQLPFALIISRVFIGLGIIALSILQTENYALWIVTLMIIGLLTDVFDGIIARKLNVSTEKLRVWDSNVDLFFWLTVIGAIFYLNWPFVKGHFGWIVAVLLMESIGYLISYIKFKKPVATHSILAKFWTITLLGFLIDLTLNTTSSAFFFICIGLGLISRLEIILIIIKLSNWATDVPSIFSVAKINRGFPIKRNRWFNG